MPTVKTVWSAKKRRTSTRKSTFVASPRAVRIHRVFPAIWAVHRRAAVVKRALVELVELAELAALAAKAEVQALAELAELVVVQPEPAVPVVVAEGLGFDARTG